jgi:DNA-3-methyladenine glycosylase
MSAAELITTARPLSRRVLLAPAPEAARALIGCLIVHDTPAGLTAARIIETEAYDQSEPAAHSFRGPTPRTQIMFGPAGFAYVYFSYGVHWCMNVVTGPSGHGSAVLLRAAEPLAGLELMAKRRGLEDHRRLLRGPGCLAGGPLRLLAPAPGRRPAIITTTRIGISKAKDLPWRFCEADNPLVSGSRGQKPR